MRIDRLKLKILMYEKDMTLTKLSDLSGVSKNIISLIRSGKSCSDKTAELLAKGLSVSIDDLKEVNSNVF